MPSATRPTRIGMIVPSSNTCLEPQSYRILGDRDDVTIHFARIPVTRIALDESSDKQFDAAVMRSAAETPRHRRRRRHRLERHLRLLARRRSRPRARRGNHGRHRHPCHHLHAGVHGGLPDLRHRTDRTLHALHGGRQPRDRGVVRTGRHQDAGPPVPGPERQRIIRPGLRRRNAARVAGTCGVSNPDALVYLCTNLYGANIAEEIEAAMGVPVLDSVAVTLWHCLKMTGVPLLSPRWGRLLASA